MMAGRVREPGSPFMSIFARNSSTFWGISFQLADAGVKKRPLSALCWSGVVQPAPERPGRAVNPGQERRSAAHMEADAAAASSSQT